MSDKHNFTFEHRGETIEFAHPLDEIRTPRWLRANRRRDELDLAFTIIEEFGGPKVVEVVDEMTKEEFEVLSLRLQKEIGATLGE